VTRRALALNPIACDGHGICAELLPEMIKLDDWGYPIIDPTPVPPGLEGLARRAVAACPTLALRLRRLEAPLAAPARR
jgi:ferredoxin